VEQIDGHMDVQQVDGHTDVEHMDRHSTDVEQIDGHSQYTYPFAPQMWSKSMGIWMGSKSIGMPTIVHG